MKKYLYAVLLMLIALPATAQYRFQSVQEFASFVCNYYRDPRPEEIVPSFEYFVALPYIDGNSAMIGQFYAELVREDSDLLKTLFDESGADTSDQPKIFMLQILARLDTRESAEYLMRAQKEWPQESVQGALTLIKSGKNDDLFAEAPENTKDLDRLWGAFWASGNERAIRRIISVLYLWEAGRGARAAIGGAAKWSLTKNARNHPAILSVIKAERDNASGTQKRLLQEIVTEVEGS